MNMHLFWCHFTRVLCVLIRCVLLPYVYVITTLQLCYILVLSNIPNNILPLFCWSFLLWDEVLIVVTLGIENQLISGMVSNDMKINITNIFENL